MSIEFFQSMMGRKFYEADVPRITKALERIADALEERNERIADALQERRDTDMYG